MKKEELNKYLLERIELAMNKEVTDALSYTNGILFHGVPSSLSESDHINWASEDKMLVVKNAITKYTANELIFNQTNDGLIGVSEKEYTLLFNNGIIEAFSTRVVRQTPINFPPKIRYVQVEAVVENTMKFIEYLMELSENVSAGKVSFDMYISLIGIKGVVFNVTEKDYTTTVNFPDDTLMFQINDINGRKKEDILESIKDSFDKTLFQFEPVV